MSPGPVLYCRASWTRNPITATPAPRCRWRWVGRARPTSGWRTRQRAAPY